MQSEACKWTLSLGAPDKYWRVSLLSCSAGFSPLHSITVADTGQSCQQLGQTLQPQEKIIPQIQHAMASPTFSGWHETALLFPLKWLLLAHLSRYWKGRLWHRDRNLKTLNVSKAELFSLLSLSLSFSIAKTGIDARKYFLSGGNIDVAILQLNVQKHFFFKNDNNLLLVKKNSFLCKRLIKRICVMADKDF